MPKLMLILVAVFAFSVQASSSFGAVKPGTKPGQIWADNGLRMQFCWCPPGSFTWGRFQRENARGGTDRGFVSLTKGFWLGQTEITQVQWQQVMGTSPWKGKQYVKVGRQYPATYVSWEDALAFCRKFTLQERKAGRLPADWEYTLPTEAQWEYACRAGTTTRYSFGNDREQSLVDRYMWSDRNTRDVKEPYPHQVNRKKANPWNLHDMHGNVCEWCRDWYQGVLVAGTDPEVTGKTQYRVNRGGGWAKSPLNCTSSDRFYDVPGTRYCYLGFRVVLKSTR